jgi:hypothetical protein
LQDGTDSVLFGVWPQWAVTQEGASRRAGIEAFKVMLKDRQEILAVGELVLFLATWFATVWAAVDHFRQNGEYVPGNNLAATSGYERTLEKK